MKVKILTSYPKSTLEVGEVYFSSDLHLNHEAVIKYGRRFGNVVEMNTFIISDINSKVRRDDLLVLLGDTMMVNKDYESFLSSIICENVIILVGNHCSLSKLLALQNNPKVKYVGYYLELVISGQIVCCSHYPMFHWNYQDEGSFMLHGHLHGDKSNILRLMHEYKSMDVGVDSYYNLFGKYGIFSFSIIKDLLNGRKIIGRHE